MSVNINDLIFRLIQRHTSKEFKEKMTEKSKITFMIRRANSKA